MERFNRWLWRLCGERLLYRTSAPLYGQAPKLADLAWPVAITRIVPVTTVTLYPGQHLGGIWEVWGRTVTLLKEPHDDAVLPED